METAENFQAFESSMIELAELTKTAGGLVIDQFTQKRERPDSRTMIGSGKLEQMRWAIEVGEIDTVIFNDRLSPRQNVNLEEALGVKVIDRMQLILDILLCVRARMKECFKLKKPSSIIFCLVWWGKGLCSAVKVGGIGSKGPGETKLETDRRYIRTRIENIDKALKKLKNKGKYSSKTLEIRNFSDWFNWLHQCRKIQHYECFSWA